MKRITFLIILLMVTLFAVDVQAQSRRPIDSRHPLWLIHVDVWNKADPQKIIDLIPDNIKPYVCMNLSLSCQYDTEKNVYKMPQNAVRTYKSWASVCQANGMWFTCQPASGGHTHIQDDDLETFEYFYKQYPNFLGWNYAEQFWGFDEAGDKSSSSQVSRIALFAKLVPMAHKYGGFLTVSFCGNIWSHPLNPVGMMKRNADLLRACEQYPEAMLWLYKYTTSSCFYNNESVTYSPFISGLAKNYGVRYDNCGWNGALDAILGDGHGKKYPIAAGIGTVMEQTCVNGGAVWDGPELIWTEDFKNLNNTTVNGYTRRNWGTFPGFDNAWLDMFSKIIDGSMYIPTREEVIGETKVVVINDVTSGSDEQKYAAWGDLYDGLYNQTDPFNRNSGQWMDNYCYFKKTGRYHAIPVAVELWDSLAKTIPVQVKKSAYSSRWSTQAKKVAEFNRNYPVVSTGDMYVNRFKNQLVTYTPYSYMNSKTTASANIPLQYNTCQSLDLVWGKLSTGLIREYSDHIDFYLNNYRSDTTAMVLDRITINGARTEPTYTLTKRVNATAASSATWNEETGVYELLVKHNGPVDVVVSCQGDETDRSSDVINSSALSLSLPKQPADYNGPIIIEAEDMDYKNIKSCVTDPYTWYPNVRGHAGNGFAEMGTNTAGALTHTLNIKHAGSYDVSIRYSALSSKANIVGVLGGVRKSIVLDKTATNEWKKATVTVSLKEGANTFTYTNTGGKNMYIDNVTYTPSSLPAEKFAVTVRDAEHGTVEVDADSAAEGDVVSLTVTADEGYALQGWTVVHGDVTVTDAGTFIMPDDNVTLQPIFKDMTAVYTLDYTDVLAGTIPAGWQCVQENGDTHSYPNSYSAGARVFSGFTGYQGKALYWRENTAEYGRQAGYLLSLGVGKYKLTYAMAAWKASPRYKVRILTTSGDIIAESSLRAAAPNANGNTGANVSKAVEYSMEFSVTEENNYIISFINTDYVDGFDEFLLLECRVNSVPEDTGIEHVCTDVLSAEGIVYNLQGVRVGTDYKGIVIVNGRKVLRK